MSNIKEKSVQEIFDELDKIIIDMENGEYNLEESFEKYKSGVEMLEKCKNKIDEIESKLKDVTKTEEVQ